MICIDSYSWLIIICLLNWSSIGGPSQNFGAGRSLLQFSAGGHAEPLHVQLGAADPMWIPQFVAGESHVFFFLKLQEHHGVSKKFGRHQYDIQSDRVRAGLITAGSPICGRLGIENMMWSLKPVDWGTVYAQVSQEVSAGRMSSTPCGRLVMGERKPNLQHFLRCCSNHQEIEK